MRIPYRKPTKFSHIDHDPLITEEKFKDLKQKLDRLKSIRPGLAREVSRLAEMGDFSENAEYQIAKGRLRGVNQRMLILENQLNQAVIITPQKQTDRVQIGHTVTVLVDDKEKTYQILGSSETNPAKGIISHNSPIGSALVGHHAGETITIRIAGRDIEYRILKTA